MKMSQEDGVKKYQNKDENLRIRMERVMPHLEEDYFLCGFIGGLKDEIRPMVRMHESSNNLAHAFKIARFQEQLLGYSKKTTFNSKPAQVFSKPTTCMTNSFSSKPNQTLPNYSYPPKPPNMKFVTSSKIPSTAPILHPNSGQTSSQSNTKQTQNPNPKRNKAA